MKTPIKMSSLTDNTTYTGKDALEFYSKALLTGDTKSMIKLIADVKSKVKLPRLDLANILQEADCSFGASGTATLSQKTLEVCPIKINLEFCTADFEVNFLSEQLRPGSNQAQVPDSFEAYLMEQISLNISKDLEYMLWQGDTAGSPVSICDGFIKKFLADAAVIDVNNTTVSASNVIAELGKVYAAIPDTIIDADDLVIFVPKSIMKFYVQAIAALNPLGGSYNVGDYTLAYLNIPIVVAPGLPADTMVACRTSNLWYGTDLVNDIDDVLIIPQLDKTGANAVRFVANFKFGVEYGIGEEIVLYS